MYKDYTRIQKNAITQIFGPFQGSSSGGAIGFRISSLSKLLMTKSNTAKMTLLHYLIEEAQEKNKDALNFVEDLLEPLQKASRFVVLHYFFFS